MIRARIRSTPARRYMESLMSFSLLSNTPWSPAHRSQGRVQTWVTSQWKLLASPGHFSAAINNLSLLYCDISYVFEIADHRAGIVSTYVDEYSVLPGGNKQG
mgnify:CR=1 FL=1